MNNYPIATVADSENADLAQEFVDLVLGDEGQQVLAGRRVRPALTCPAPTRDVGVPALDLRPGRWRERSSCCSRCVAIVSAGRLGPTSSS